MVRLSGFTVKDISNLNGDIEIVCTGLRPGEKLFEELLIDAKSLPTAHSLIFRAEESSLEPDQLWPQLDELLDAIHLQDVNSALGHLAAIVQEWKPEVVNSSHNV